MRQIFSFLLFLTIFSANINAQSPPYQVVELNPNDATSYARQLIAFRDSAFFFARNTDYTEAMWAFNPTDRQIYEITDQFQFFNDGLANLDDEKLLIFSGYPDYEGALNLLTWDGSSAEVIKNLSADFPIEEFGSLGFSHSFGNMSKGLVFRLFTSKGEFQTWITDGTELGTKLLHINDEGNFNPYTDMQVYDDHIFFIFQDALWYSDGTPENTQIIDEDENWLNFANRSNVLYRGAVFQGNYYFTKVVDGTCGIYKYDISTGDFDRVNSIDPLGEANDINDVDVFLSEDAVFAFHDGTVYRIEGSQALVEYESDPFRSEFLGALNGLIFFTQNSFDDADFKLISYDGIEAKNITFENAPITYSNYPNGHFLLDDNLLFQDTNAQWYMLNSLTREIQTIDIPSNIQLPSHLVKKADGPVNVGNYYLFMVNSSTIGREVLTINRQSGEAEIRNMNSRKASARIKSLSAYNGYLYFMADDGSGDDIYRLDRQQQSEKYVDLINDIGWIHLFKDQLIYTSIVPNTAGPTLFFDDLTGGIENQEFRLPSRMGRYAFSYPGHDYFYFKVQELTLNTLDSTTLWFSDGTAVGTKKIISLEGNDVGGSAETSIESVWNDDYYFVFDSDASGGGELWVSDRTTEGTHMVNSSMLYDVRDLFNVGNRLFATQLDSSSFTKLFEILDNAIVEISTFEDLSIQLLEFQGQLILQDNNVMYELRDGVLDTLFETSGQQRFRSKLIKAGEKLLFHTIDQNNIYTWLMDETHSLFEVVDTVHNALSVSNQVFVDGFYLASFSSRSSGNEMYVLDFSTFNSELFNDVAFNPGVKNLGNSVYFPYNELYAFDLPQPFLSVSVDSIFLEPSSTYDLGKLEIGSQIDVSLVFTNDGIEPLTMSNMSLVGNDNITLGTDIGSTYEMEESEEVLINVSISANEFGEGIMELSVETNIPGNSSISYQISYEVTRKLQNIQIELPEELVFGDPDFTIGFEGGASGNPVILESSDSEVIQISDNIVSINNAGVAKIIASQEGNDEYDAGYIEIDVLVNQASQTIEFLSPTKVELASGFLMLEAEATSGLDVNFELEDTNLAELSGDTLFFRDIGFVSLRFNQEGDRNYEPSPNYGTTVEIAEEVLSIDSNLPNLKIYPNPADQELRIELPNHIIASIRMIDLSGKIWHESNTQSATSIINVKHLPTGIYALQLQATSRDQTTRKVLIQR